MESTPRTRMEQLVDWRAAVIAGLVGGLVFLLIQMLGQAMVIGGSAWLFPRYVAAMVMGEQVLLGDLNIAVVLVGLLVHFVLALIFGLILAAIIHEWNLMVGIIVGALFGLALYAINYYTMTRFFSWFYPVYHWLDITAHVLYGLTAGAVYELLEVERFVPVYDADITEE
jgi:hypothetical protein